MGVNFQDRVERLRKITERLPVTRAFPLLYEVKIDEGAFSLISFFTKLYLAASLRAAGSASDLTGPPDSFLEDYKEEILNLPNITPNGHVMPKRDNMLEFNLLHRTVAEMFAGLEIDQHIGSIFLPAMLRLVDGVRVEEKEKRPYASTKLHTDVWNGDPGRQIMIFLPALGDTERTGIEFYEPDEKAMQGWIRDLPDYNAGAHLISSAKRYDIKWQKGFIYFADQLLLHRTMKSGGGLRANIDFRIMPQEEVQSDSKEGEIKDERVSWRNFTTLPQWYAVGEKTIFAPEETFQEAKERFQMGASGVRAAPVNYKAGFNIISLV